MSAALSINRALQQLADQGAAQRELDQARAVLAWLAENNRGAVRVDLGRGVTAQVPENTLARGLTTRPRDW